MDKMEKSNEEK